VFLELIAEEQHCIDFFQGHGRSNKTQAAQSGFLSFIESVESNGLRVTRGV